MKYAAIGPIAVYLPQRVETNAQLQAEHPEWDMELIASKTGVFARHIAEPGECSSDLAVAAARALEDAVLGRLPRRKREKLLLGLEAMLEKYREELDRRRNHTFTNPN